jgi:hypothetical protein
MWSSVSGSEAATETLQMVTLRSLWWQSSLSLSLYRTWDSERCATFWDGSERLEDGERSWRQEPIERLKWSKHLGNWFQLIVEWLFGWRKGNSKLAEKQLEKSRWKLSLNGRYALGSFRYVWPKNRRLSGCQLVRSLFTLWTRISPGSN